MIFFNKVDKYYGRHYTGTKRFINK